MSSGYDSSGLHGHSARVRHLPAWRSHDEATHEKEDLRHDA
jgi:hypothetical protein